MRSHIREQTMKYFPEDEPVVLEEIVVTEEDMKEDEPELDGTAYPITYNFLIIII